MDKAEIEQYRERLFALRRRLSDEVAELDEAIAGEGSDPGDLSHLPTHGADRDSEELGATEAMERNQVAMLKAVEDALARIEAGSFGRCTDCGSVIPAKRLEAIPYTAYCLDCELARE